MSRFGDDGPYRELSAKMLAGILHLHRGTPYVYQGEELGMTNMSFGTISDYRDIEVLNHHREATTHLGHTDADVLAALAPLNRDNARTPVQWDASRHGGFTTGAPWIAVNPNTSHINAAEQEDNPDSVFSFYRQVIALRHAEPVVAEGDFTMLLPDDDHVYAFRRSLPAPAADPVRRQDPVRRRRRASSCWCWATSPGRTGLSPSTAEAGAMPKPAQTSPNWATTRLN